MSKLFSIAPMREEDLPDVVAIERLCFGDRWSINAFRNEIENENGHYFVARAGDQIVGYAGFWLILEEAHITTIAVHPECRGRRYGEKLLVALIDHAMEKGAKWLTLEVRVSNETAKKLYEKYGFQSLGRRKGYYQDNGEDALVMWTENVWQPDYRRRFEDLKTKLDRARAEEA
ncbi:MAG: ribosomal protein S18-alanine N-acetyltransferase [Bacteroidota bacterium]